LKPLRRKNIRQVTYDPDTGQDREWQLKQRLDVLSSEGCVDTTGTVRNHFKDCGCNDEIGGRCYVCGAVSCTSCHGRCNKCKKPICMQHSNFLEKENAEKERLCESCYDAITRKQKFAKVGRLFLSLFCEMEDKTYG
jgi:hypothetical protein